MMLRLLCLLLCPLAAFAQTAPPQRTVIQSDLLEMQGSGDKNYFYFRGNVEATGTNLSLRCDELTVVAGRTGDPEAAVGELGAIESIIAQGNVAIQQVGRQAFAGRAEVDPVAGTVILSDNPRVIDGDIEASAYQFVLYQGERKIRAIGDPSLPAPEPGSRTVVRLGRLPDLGFDQPEEGVTVDDAILRQLPPQPEAGEMIDLQEPAAPPAEAPLPGPETPANGESTPPSEPASDSPPPAAE